MKTAAADTNLMHIWIQILGQTLSSFFADFTQRYFHVKWCVHQRKKSNGLKMAPISVYATYCAHMFPSFLHYKRMHINFQNFHVLPRFHNKNSKRMKLL